MPRRGKVNLETARVYRTRGWSYDRIARRQGVSASAVYWALNKHKRRQGNRTSRTRATYVRDEVWAVVEAHARKYTLSPSEVAAAILAGELPDTRVLKEALEGPPHSAEELWRRAQNP